MFFSEWFEKLEAKIGYEETLKYDFAELNSMYLKDYKKMVKK